MSSVLASSLRGCDVMTTDGTKIGTVESITMNTKTGTLDQLRLAPTDQTPGRFDRVDDGQIVVPAGNIEAKDDYLVVTSLR
ncbi:photosystem reaction center subunit H [Halobellus sp. Atlit-38R]|jgi:sporulation protein YlmC with PRC-barrel domain|uniref:PRC-barrel domain-containing protein n=1 Tax=Halobellus sp. Atlit-38R TaxID=2282131 RepID=UPI000EF23E6D|nr:PRC-barrel domain-containing protein [Halobellus sp. Atlit-38R]RLM94762.1 photosystem reaction center subunit H [Halobellus sp. Atlit-38R]